MTATFVLLLLSPGCVRRDGRNSDCRWPAETGRRIADARHLSADAEFAEDLAIRYADTHHGLRTPYFVSGQAYGTARDQCLEMLFEQIAKTHGVQVEDVSRSLGRNRAYIDVAVNLPFVLVYCLAAIAVARTIWRRYRPTEHGWLPGTVMVLFLSLVFAAGGLGLGEMWCSIAETIRVGNGHMSYRGERLWWVRHRTELFAGGVVVFLLFSAVTARAARIRTARISGFG